MCVVYTVASIRTNLVFFLIFVGLDIALSFLAASFWHAGQGNAATALRLQVVSVHLAKLEQIAISLETTD
jgi:hypothetical protein